MNSEQLKYRIKRQPWDRVIDVRIACCSAVGRQVEEVYKKYGFSEMLSLEREITTQAREDSDEQ